MFHWEDAMVTIPRTVVLTTDIFDEFMEDDNLYDFALSDVSDEEVIEKFSNAITPSTMRSKTFAARYLGFSSRKNRMVSATYSTA